MDGYIVAWTDKEGNNKWVSRDSQDTADEIRTKLLQEPENSNVGVFTRISYYYR